MISFVAGKYGSSSLQYFYYFIIMCLSSLTYCRSLWQFVCGQVVPIIIINYHFFYFIIFLFFIFFYILIISTHHHYSSYSRVIFYVFGGRTVGLTGMPTALATDTIAEPRRPYTAFFPQCFVMQYFSPALFCSWWSTPKLEPLPTGGRVQYTNCWQTASLDRPTRQSAQTWDPTVAVHSPGSFPS